MDGAVRAVFGYFFLVFMTRIVGRRPGRQMTPFEYVLIFFIGGLTLTAMVGDDRSVANAYSQIIAVAAAHFALTWMKKRWYRFGLIADGTPLVLLEKGKWRTETMSKALIQDDDVMASARDQGLERLDQIDYAVLERNGEISIIPASKDS
jgi:uncharacterized membrane protein YcaP (DUF421 family)